jgi:NADH-quinone oxidoreductase subunit J
MTYQIVFWVASILAVASALGVVLSGNPFYSALSLIMNLASLATLYLLLRADFLAAAQVIVYAGAVMIMFLFVIAYLGGRADEPGRDRPWWQAAAAVVAAAAVAVEIIVAVTSANTGPAAHIGIAFGSPSEVGRAFFSRYLLAFEGTSILLLAAAVGGVVLGARRPGLREPGEPEPFTRPERVPELELQASVMAAETSFRVGDLRRRELEEERERGRVGSGARSSGPAPDLPEDVHEEERR